uniref:HTH three-helical bundle domain-containing protein n=1 Tax=Nelumbo nucifera TaxID=4432 RepID=A0A822ZBB7_NELNU|nr:TPA_asm: hypothetical protein HUJ06_000642 [Nelumbo nucifera]
MGAFPCLRERKAATALLLLSSSSSSSSSNNSSSLCLSNESYSNNYTISSDGKEESSPSGSNSKSCSSSLTNEGSSERNEQFPLRVLAAAARCHEIKLKAVRRRRSKNYKKTDSKKMISGVWEKPVILAPATVSEVTEVSSLSSASSSVASALPNHRLIRLGKKLSLIQERGEERRRQKISSGCLRRRAEAIMKFLSVGCASEVRIRQALGDSPDTSKALRMLVKLEEIKRSGAGGRTDPYIYTVIPIPVQIVLGYVPIGLD